MLDIDGQCKNVVLEALKCPSPDLNNGEDNAAFKSLVGTLLTCPGRGYCNDPLVCRDCLFQCKYPKTDDEAAVFTARHQWKARRAEIEVLAKQADTACDAERGIPVLADVTMLRSHLAPGSFSTPISWPFWLCMTQLWIQKTQRGYPACAPLVLEYLGHVLHHPAQMSMAQFSAHQLRDVIFNLDMLSIARTTKLLPQTAKIKAEDEEVDKEALRNALSEMNEAMEGCGPEVFEEEEELSVQCYLGWRKSMKAKRKVGRKSRTSR